ncbi:MAG: hypothetical protein ACYC9J_00180 [Sulfuricaulis sp.]
MSLEDPFHAAFRGNFVGVLSWEDLDSLWQVIRKNVAAGWYLYAIGETTPLHPATVDEVNNFLVQIDKLLRREHQEDYCGIVYTDSKTAPSMVKIFDPNNLGAQCGFSDNPPLPGWIMSRLPPVTLDSRDHRPLARQRWWRKIWG